MEFTDLIQQPESHRDLAWETAFLDQFTGLKVQVEGEMAQTGPDGWPYLHVRTSPDGTEPALRVVQWLVGRGIGLVVNAHKMLPDYIFTYGMLWNFVETGRFILPAEAAPEGSVVFGEGSLMGPPSEKYLPPYVRSVMREFLRVQGFPAPKILVVTNADYKEVDLVLSIDSLNRLPVKDHKVMAEMLAWFLPLHYRLVLAEESAFREFFPL